jgi:hypothetical protein
MILIVTMIATFTLAQMLTSQSLLRQSEHDMSEGKSHPQDSREE